jgi:hypothetical protein
MKVVCRLVGGLGNQLFIYAAARRLALANGVQLVVDAATGFERDDVYCRSYQLSNFHIPEDIVIRKTSVSKFLRLRRYFGRLFDRVLPFGFRRYLCQDDNDFDSRLINFRVLRDVYLEGYWQSELYFKDMESKIRSDLRFIPPADDLNQSLADCIRRSASVAVHIRFFDGPSESGESNVSDAYYKKAIAFMELRVPGAHYFVFSDRPAIALERVSFPKGRVSVVSHNQGDGNAYADLWLMSLCENFIIANSTFSWWGAWLSERHSSCIVAPAVRISSGKMAWGFDGLLPDRWTKL